MAIKVVIIIKNTKYFSIFLPKFNSPFWDYASSLPFEGIIEPSVNDEYGQWTKNSFKIWRENTALT